MAQRIEKGGLNVSFQLCSKEVNFTIIIELLSRTQKKKKPRHLLTSLNTVLPN